MDKLHAAFVNVLHIYARPEERGFHGGKREGWEQFEIGGIILGIDRLIPVFSPQIYPNYKL